MISPFIKRCLILSFSFLIFTQAFSQNDAKVLQGALRPERTCFDVVFYDLHLKVVPEKKSVSGYNEIFFKVITSTKRIQLDLFANMEIDSIVYKKQKLDYERKYNAVFIEFPEFLPDSSVQSLSFFYHGSPKTGVGAHGDAGFHWEKDKNGKNLIGISCEDVGASLWYPNKDHLSDEPDSARLHWTIPDELTCISNGKLIYTRKESDNYTTWVWFVRNPINNYNITFYLGDYKRIVVKLKSGNKINLIECYFYSGALEEAKKYFTISAIMVEFCENLFGEYAFWDDKFAIVQAPYRGMEHQSCINIGSEISNYTNWSYNINVPYHSTLLHEIAHEWWGNSVSVADIADMWIHEGFATYTETLFVEFNYGKKYYDQMINHFRSLAPYSNPIVGKRNVYYNIFATNLIYFRGAVFLDELRRKIKNDELFFAILKTFQQRFKKKIVTTEDFLKVTNELTGKSFDAFFKEKLFR